MRKEKTCAAVLFLVFTLGLLTAPSSAAESLSPNDFKLQSFSKTVDFFDFARSYAASHNKTPPPTDLHAYLYLTYVNVSGFQLYFSGLINITAKQGALTIPVQSFLEHYNAPSGKDVLTSSSFIMLLAFNDTADTLYPDSPDRNDHLYASFSLGLDLDNIFGVDSKPALSSKTTIIPLTPSEDKLTWEWGMRYHNLTAVWWRMFTEPLHPRFEPRPVAITTYEELTFTYKLTLNPTDGTATVTANYIIGRMTNLWMCYWLFFIPVVTHYNSTGAYRVNGTRISNETIYQYLERQHIKMSIVLFQNSLVLGHTTKSTFNDQDVVDAEVDVSSGAISTEAGDEKIFETNFGTKKQYRLFNYTVDPTETAYDTYDAVTRTSPRHGFARNPLFAMHIALLNYVPLIVAHIDPPLYQDAKDHILNMTYADYFYLISYPKYSGFKVMQDPTYTAYVATTSPTTGLPNLLKPIVITGMIAAVIIGAAAGTVFVLKRRSSKTQSV